MTLAEHIHVSLYRLPRGYAQTALLAAIRPEWPDEVCRLYVEHMTREDLESAFVALSRMVASYDPEI